MTVVQLRNPGHRGSHPISSLISLSRRTRTLVGLTLAEIGLATGEDEVLCALQDGKTRSITELAASLSVRFQTLSRLVDALAGKGMIELLAGPHARISEKGSMMIDRIAELRVAIDTDLASEFGDDWERVAAVLHTIDRALEKKLSFIGS